MTSYNVGKQVARASAISRPLTITICVRVHVCLQDPTYGVIRLDEVKLIGEGSRVIGSCGHEHVMADGQVVGRLPVQGGLGRGAGIG